MFTLIKNIFLDIFNLFRNFFHWNLSKIFILIWSFVLSFLSILPFVLIIFIYWYFAWIDLTQLFFQILSKQLWTNLFVNLLLYIIIIIFFIIYLYQYILLIKLNFEYLEWKKLKYIKNYYFNITKIKRYIILTLLNFAVLLIPVIFFLLIIWILMIFNWSINETINSLLTSGNNFFSWFSFISFIISIIAFIYILFRICFSYFIFIDDEKNEKKILYYFKKSFKITKWFKVFFKFLSILIIFLIIQFPIRILLNFSEQSSVSIGNYIIYKNLDQVENELVFRILSLPEKKITNVDDLEIYKNLSKEEQNLLSFSNINYLQSLILEYSKFSDKQLNSNIRKYDRYIILLNIINFLFLYWITSMVFVSFYKRELVKNK